MQLSINTLNNLTITLYVLIFDLFQNDLKVTNSKDDL